METTDLFGYQESAGDYGDTESFDDEGDDDAEATSAAVRRRREVRDRRDRRRAALALRQDRAQRAARTRTRRAIGGGRPAPTTRAAVRTTQVAVRDLNLETKVQIDALRSALAAQSKRTSRSEASAVTSALASQFQGSFPQLVTHPAAKAVLSFAPLLLLSPAKKGTGVGAFASDPRVWGFGGIAALAVVAHFVDGGRGVRITRITASVATVASGPPAGTAQFSASIHDAGGNVVPGQITWISSDPAFATVDRKSGLVTAVSAGRTKIFAIGDGTAAFDSADLRVT
jgi:Bacterial Ig-like domain (group 2)